MGYFGASESQSERGRHHLLQQVEVRRHEREVTDSSEQTRRNQRRQGSSQGESTLQSLEISRRRLGNSDILGSPLTPQSLLCVPPELHNIEIDAGSERHREIENQPPNKHIRKDENQSLI